MEVEDGEQAFVPHSYLGFTFLLYRSLCIGLICMEIMTIELICIFVGFAFLCSF